MKGQLFGNIYILSLIKEKRANKWVEIENQLSNPACNIGLLQIEPDKLLIFGGWDNAKKLDTVCEMVEQEDNKGKYEISQTT